MDGYLIAVQMGKWFGLNGDSKIDEQGSNNLVQDFLQNYFVRLLLLMFALSALTCVFLALTSVTAYIIYRVCQKTVISAGDMCSEFVESCFEKVKSFVRGNQQAPIKEQDGQR
jgi:hypothetical protein